MRLTRPLIVATVLAGLFAAVPLASAGVAVRLPSPAIVMGHESQQLTRLHALSRDAVGDIVPDATVNTTSIWSGWVDKANTNVELRFVTANFVVPSVTCPGFGYDSSFWVGLDGWGSSTVEQVGVDGYCDIQGPNGVLPEYFSWYEMYPNGTVAQNYVSPGDVISVSVYYDSSTSKYDLALSDSNSTSPDISVAKYCPSGHTCHNASAEVITEDPGGGPTKSVYLAKFSKVNFSLVAVTSRNGTHGTLEGNSLWSAHEIIMEYPGTTVMAQPSDRTSGYTAFSDTYKSSG
jgi:peptidase A4-like protein